MKKGVEAVGGIAERYMIRWLGPRQKDYRAAVQERQAHGAFGVLAVVVSLILIVTDATWFRSFYAEGPQLRDHYL